MAGGKETPRQKMIGMMYLVLTALLALQVSSAIVQKFVFLDESLRSVNDKTVHESHLLVTKIQKAVEAEGGKDKAVFDKASDVRAKTEVVIKKIEDIRAHLIKITGGKDEEGKYIGAKEEELVAIEMVGHEGRKGMAYKLKDDLNAYSVYLDEVGSKMRDHENKVDVPPLAIDAKDHPLFKKDEEQRNKDFANLNFSHTPLVAALAVLSQQESQILKYESEVLGGLAKEVGAADIKFDNVYAMVRPLSSVVAAGTKYEADLFLGASASSITPTMTRGGQKVEVDPQTKKGKIVFTAQASNYDKEGNSKQKWKGEISFKFKGKDTTFSHEEEYIVAKPVIQIQSASVQALYRNCGNELNVQVPALGSTYNPSFSANGATVITGQPKGKVTLIPNGAKVTLTVASGGFTIGSESFGVRLIPKPTIECLNGRSPVNEKTGVAAPGPRSLTMKAVPDDGFATFLPKDARYNVAEWDCILVRGKRPVATNNFKKETGDLTNFASSAQPGDRILIEVKKVTRKNFQDKVEDVSLGTIIKNIPLN